MQRIQLSRRRGWRLPDGARSVARPGRWGNPYAVADYGARAVPLFANTARGIWDASLVADLDADAIARTHAAHVAWLARIGGDPVARARAELAGFDLACWCAPGTPCHADVLLALANLP